MNLKPIEIGILTLSPSNGSTEWTGEDQKHAHRLVKRGLLVADPADPCIFRCTTAGASTLTKLMKEAGLIQS